MSLRKSKTSQLVADLRKFDRIIPPSLDVNHTYHNANTPELKGEARVQHLTAAPGSVGGPKLIDNARKQSELCAS